jgi:hypothetical protein
MEILLGACSLLRALSFRAGGRARNTHEAKCPFGTRCLGLREKFMLEFLTGVLLTLLVTVGNR